MANDHTVPRMYLRRFAQQRQSKAPIINAARVDTADKMFPVSIEGIAAEADFYTVETPDGVPRKDLEKLFSRIEYAATPVLSAMLDDHDYALLRRWPLKDEERERFAWWIAAQMLRTTRQRERLMQVLSDDADLSATNTWRSAKPAHAHFGFVVAMLEPLAAIINARPWGIGFSDACLPTSDVPVVILNAHDSANQLLAAALWDIVLPLDPHRFLFLPGFGTTDADPLTTVDHRVKFNGGIGIMLAQIIFDAADKWVLCHPEHDGLAQVETSAGGRLPAPSAGTPQSPGPQYIFDYVALHPSFTVERTHLDHPKF